MRNQSPGEQIWANSRLFIAVRTSPDGGVGGVWRRSLGWLWRGGKELSCEGVAPSAACLPKPRDVLNHVVSHLTSDAGVERDSVCRTFDDVADTPQSIDGTENLLSAPNTSGVADR